MPFQLTFLKWMALFSVQDLDPQKAREQPLDKLCTQRIVDDVIAHRRFVVRLVSVRPWWRFFDNMSLFVDAEQSSSVEIVYVIRELEEVHDMVRGDLDVVLKSAEKVVVLQLVPQNVAMLTAQRVVRHTQRHPWLGTFVVCLCVMQWNRVIPDLEAHTVGQGVLDELPALR